MPTYRMHLTTLAACLVSIGSVSAQGDGASSSARAENAVGMSEVQERLITVEESVGVVTPLRQSHRLDVTRFKAPALDEAVVALPATSSVAAASPAASAPAAHTERLGQQETLQVSAADDEKSTVMRAARQAPLHASALAGRLIELMTAGALTPAQAADLISRLEPGQAALSEASLLVAEVEDTLPTAIQPAAFIEVLTAPAPRAAEKTLEVVVAAPAETPAGVVAKTTQSVAVSALPPTAEELNASLPVITLSTGVDPAAVAPLDLVDAKLPPAADALPPPVSAAPAAPPVQLASATVMSDVIVSPLASPLVVASASDGSSAASAPKSWVLSREDRTIKSALERWAQLTEWQVAWEFPTDFQIEFNARFDGDFVDAVTRVVEGLAGPERPIRAEFYNGNRVLRIVSGRE